MDENENDDEFFLDDDELSLEERLDNDIEKLVESKKQVGNAEKFPDELFILPLTRRPFFPGMAAPLVIETGEYYEVLKRVAKSEDKVLGLFLSKDEHADIYDLGHNDLYQVGVVASILRIVPLEQGGAQVVLNMEKRVEIVEPIPGKELQAKVKYHDDIVPNKETRTFVGSTKTF